MTRRRRRRRHEWIRFFLFSCIYSFFFATTLDLAVIICTVSFFSRYFLREQRSNRHVGTYVTRTVRVYFPSVLYSVIWKKYWKILIRTIIVIETTLWETTRLRANRRRNLWGKWLENAHWHFVLSKHICIRFRCCFLCIAFNRYRQ